MKQILENYIYKEQKFDRIIQPTDWRYSASIVGLKKYLDYYNIIYEYLDTIPQKEKPQGVVNGFDGLLYNSDDITEEKYFNFVYYYFKEDMTHSTILEILENSFNEEDIKKVNELVSSKKVLKDIFGKVKFDGANKDFYINEINNNLQKITKEIFRYAKNLYADFCNTNLLLTEDNPHCRLIGYNVDEGRKTKYLGFCFDKDTFVGNDILEFDFIPFAFSKSYESYFINNNFDIKILCHSNAILTKSNLFNQKGKTSRVSLMELLKESTDFVNYDVEIITKSRNQERFETLFVRFNRLEALRKVRAEYLHNHKITDDNWLNLQEEVYNRCLNNVMLDSLIESMFKNFSDFPRDIDRLIEINTEWKGAISLKKVQRAKFIGYDVTKALSGRNRDNSVTSFKQKLIGAIVAHDYERAEEIILKISAYSNVECDFIYDLLDDFENNKEVAMAFANALGYKGNNDDNNNNNEKEND